MRLAVAGISARMLAEAAARDGHTVFAGDLFGDADTRAAAAQWSPIGAAVGLRIDGARLTTMLRAAARQGATGWIAASGFEAEPALLDQGAAVLPLLGTPSDAVRRVRDPGWFFDLLDRHSVGHPAVRFDPPPREIGWLQKDAGGSGGWQVRRWRTDAAVDDALPRDAAVYWQREAPGTPMSATFLAAADGTRLLGINRLLTHSYGAHPFVFCGAVGPVPIAAHLLAEVQRAVDLITRAAGLRGLCSLDFLCDAASLGVLEVNPRPPATLALYAHGGGLVDDHLHACLDEQLPPAQRARTVAPRGLRIVYARSAIDIGPAHLRLLADWPDCHDRPAAPTRLAAADALCSLSAAGDPAGESADSLVERLDAARRRLLARLEAAARPDNAQNESIEDEFSKEIAP